MLAAEKSVHVARNKDRPSLVLTILLRDSVVYFEEIFRDHTVQFGDMDDRAGECQELRFAHIL